MDKHNKIAFHISYGVQCREGGVRIIMREHSLSGTVLGWVGLVECN